MGNKHAGAAHHHENKNIDLTEDTIEILMANTNLHRFEIIEWFEGFIKDAPNGKLTKAQLEKVYKELYPEGDPKKYCHHIFTAFDADSNGTIDFREFLLALSALSDRDLAKRLHLFFKVYDINVNGKIETDELAKIIDALYDVRGLPKHEREGDNAPKKRAESIMKSLDKDQNGTLSQDEFVDGCLNDKIISDLLLPQPGQ